MPTKSQQVAQLLLRAEGCTYAEVVAVTGWSAISIPWHAKSNGLRLRIEKTKGRPNRYYAERRKIEVRKVVKPWQAPVAPVAASDPLTLFCAEHGFEVVRQRGARSLRCRRCYLGFRIFQKDDSVNPYLSKHIKRHAETHHRHNAKKDVRHEQRGQLDQQA